MQPASTPQSRQTAGWHALSIRRAWGTKETPHDVSKFVAVRHFATKILHAQNNRPREVSFVGQAQILDAKSTRAPHALRILRACHPKSKSLKWACQPDPQTLDAKSTRAPLALRRLRAYHPKSKSLDGRANPTRSMLKQWRSARSIQGLRWILG